MLDSDTIEKIADLGAQADKARLFTLPDGRVVFANGVFDDKGGSKTVIETLTSPTKDARGEYLSAPSRIKKSVTIQTADSLVDYVTRFKTDGATLFADIAASKITAALDYHKDASITAHNEHHAVLAMPFSEEWKIWREVSGKRLPQLEFARFIEENAADIKAPDAATVLEAARDLQAKRNVDFSRAVRTSSDNENFEYTDQTEAKTKGGLELPTKFLLSIPVYFGGREVELGAFLRWKLDDSQLYLGIQLHRAEHVRQAVFHEVTREIAERSETPAIYAVV